MRGKERASSSTLSNCLVVESGSVLGREGDVEDKGASDGVVVGDGLVARGNNTVRAAVTGLLGDGGLAAVDGGEVGLEAGEDGEVLAVLDGVTGDLDGLTRLGGSVGCHGDGEGSDGESRVGRRAGLDEGSGQRVGLVEVEWGVEGLAEGVTLADGAGDPGGVAGLDSEDGAGGGQVVGVGDGSGGTEVSACADTLKELRGGSEGLGVGDTEGVGALLGGVGTEGGGQEVDVGLLVGTNLLETVADPVREPSSLEGGLVVGLERVAVERVLEVLEGQSVVEDDHVNVGLGSRGLTTVGGGKGREEEEEDVNKGWSRDDVDDHRYSMWKVLLTPGGGRRRHRRGRPRQR